VRRWPSAGREGKQQCRASGSCMGVRDQRGRTTATVVQPAACIARGDGSGAADLHKAQSWAPQAEHTGHVHGSTPQADPPANLCSSNIIPVSLCVSLQVRYDYGKKRVISEPLELTQVGGDEYMKRDIAHAHNVSSFIEGHVQHYS
jgi:hypothetical protein